MGPLLVDPVEVIAIDEQEMQSKDVSEVGRNRLDPMELQGIYELRRRSLVCYYGIQHVNC